MVKYCAQPTNPTKSCRAKGADLRVSFKNTFETAGAVRKMNLTRAKAFLENVMAKKECVPFRRFNGGIGRCAQAKQWKTSQGRWPLKSATYILDLLKNAESNAQFKGIEPDNLYVKHIAVHRACQMRRRTYRAHGRINPFMSTPCHVELILEERPEPVEKPQTKKRGWANKCFKPEPKKVVRPRTYSAKNRKKAAALKKAVEEAAAAGKKVKGLKKAAALAQKKAGPAKQKKSEGKVKKPVKTAKQTKVVAKK